MTDSQEPETSPILGDTPGKPDVVPGQPSRAAGGTGTHLVAEAKALIIERILLGDSNAQMDQALQAAKFLKRGQRLNPATYTEYRRSPEVKTHKTLLTDEAQQIGHAGLSEAVVVHVRTMRAAGEALFAKTGNKFSDVPPAKFRALYHALEHSASFLWESLRGEEILDEMLSQNEAEHKGTQQSSASDEIMSMMRLEIHELHLKLMQNLLAKKRRLQAESEQDNSKDG